MLAWQIGGTMAKVILAKGKEERVLSGHPWVFKSDIDKVQGNHNNGEIVNVFSSVNRFLGRGYLNLKSQISLRMMTYEHEEIDYDFLYKRILSAWEYRKRVADTN